MNAEFFFQRVKILASEQRISVKELLSKVGVPYERFRSNIRRGNFPRGDEVLSIARGLGVSVEYILDGTTSEKDRLNVIDMKNKICGLEIIVSDLQRHIDEIKLQLDSLV